MYRTIAQLDSITNLLATWFPQVFTRVQLPEASVEGRPVYALRMRAGGGGADRRGVLLVGGTHARELMNPDAIVELAIDLLVSYSNGTPVTYGGRTWPADEVNLILEALDIWLVPCSNPDGRNYVMTVNDLWRKNRRDNPNTACDGVDLNRNLDLLWGVAQGNTSCSPCADVYCGPSAFSEPETRNIKHLLDTNRIVTFADVHSYSELVLHPWGHATTQSVDITKRFTGLPTGTCTPSVPAGYQEYMDPRDLKRFTAVGNQIVADVAAVRGRHYTRETGFDLYATTGTHSDYVYSRHIADPNLYKTYGFTFETGPDTGDSRTSFHPADPTLIKVDARAAMLALLHESVCAIELIGLPIFDSATGLSAIRRVRDELLATTEAGREWIALFERVQVPAIGIILRDEKLTKSAADLFRTVAQLLGEDGSVLPRHDAERASAFIGELANRSTSETIQVDLEALRRKLNQVAGRQTHKVIEAVMRRRPDRRRVKTTRG